MEKKKDTKCLSVCPYLYIIIHNSVLKWGWTSLCVQIFYMKLIPLQTQHSLLWMKTYTSSTEVSYMQPITPRLLQLCWQDVKVGPINRVFKKMPTSILPFLVSKQEIIYFSSKPKHFHFSAASEP